MATTSTMIGTVSPGPGLVLVEFEYQYEGRDGVLIWIKPNERYELLSKTTSHWWQVRTGPGARPFYIPAKYVRELPEVPPLLFSDPIGPETTPAAIPAPLPVPVPVPKTLEETRSKSSDKVTIRLRADGGYRKQENRMSTFGVPVDFQDMVAIRGPPSRTTNVSGTTNMTEGLQPQAQGDSGKNRVAGFTDQAPVPRHQPIPVETPRAPPTHDITQEAATKKGKEEMKVETTAKKGEQEVVTVKGQQEAVTVKGQKEAVTVKGQKEAVTVKGQQEAVTVKGQKETVTVKAQKETVTVKGQQEAVTVKGQKEAVTVKGQQEAVTVKVQKETVTVKGQQEVVTVKGQKQAVTVKGQKEVVTIQGELEEEEEVVEEEPSESEEEKEERSSHIYESIQDLNIDLDALIGQESSHKQEVDDETPPSPQEAPCPIYANVSVKKQLIIPPPPSDPAPAAPGPIPSFSGSSSSCLSPASPLSPLDEWQTHTDADSGKLFYYHPLTRHSTWTQPPPVGAHLEAGPTPSQPLPEEDYPQDDSVFSSNPQLLIPRAHLDSKYDAFRSISELPAIPQRMMGNGVSEDGAVSTRTWRHSVAEDFFSSKGLAHDSLQLPDRLMLKRNLSNRSTGSNQQHGHPLEKAGILNKTKVSENGKKLRKNWSQSWTVLHGGILTFHKDPKSAPTGTNSKASQIVPEFTVELRGASLSWACNKSSKKNVLELKTRLGCEYLMQYDTESIISDWFKVISAVIRQLQEWDHLTDDSDDSDKDDKDRKSSSSRSSSGADSEQRRVRTKLRRFLQRRPTLQSVKEKGYIRDNVFGCHLDTLCHRENSTVPRFVEKCIRSVERRGLDSDGIYRVSGNLAVIQRLRHKADHEEQLDLEDGQWTEIHVITGALKLFFRELPEPLFPFSSYDRFIAAIQLPDYSQRASYIKDLVQTLPLPNHDTMELLFKHLRRVVEHKDSNRMSVQSLAIVFGPTLLRPQVESNMTVHMVFQSQIVELLLNEFSAAFPRNNQK